MWGQRRRGLFSIEPKLGVWYEQLNLSNATNNIELTVVNASNTDRGRNVVLRFGQRHRQWYSIKPTKKLESRNLKFQSICHNKNNPTIFKKVAKKRTKRSPNIIVTWKVTILL